MRVARIVRAGTGHTACPKVSCVQTATYSFVHSATSEAHMPHSNSFLHRLNFNGTSLRFASGMGVACAALWLVACAEPPASRMGGPGEGMNPESAATQREMRQQQATPPGGINPSDTNFEREDQPNKSGPPSIVKPAQ